jgi:hypothetical protein
MITRPLPQRRAYIARLALETGATLIAVGRTRSEAMRRAIALIEPAFARQYEADAIADARSA